MVGIKYNRILQEELQGLIPNKENIEPELLNDFLTYWLVRKSNAFLSAVEMQQIKESLSNVWLKLIESNQKFRTKYGENKAEEIINLIKKRG